MANDNKHALNRKVSNLSKVKCDALPGIPKVRTCCGALCPADDNVRWTFRS